jgi:GTP-binding protein
MALRLALVGRPNVGKSTLFNRLAGRRLAIVHDRPGVTRDRKYAPGRIADMELELVDTAGFDDVTDESLEARMRRQTEIAIAEADVCLFVIDARDGVTMLDKRFAELLRRAGRDVVLVANKAEGRAGAGIYADAFGLGLGEPVLISAEHGEGLGDLYAALEPHEARKRASESTDADEVAADIPLDEDLDALETLDEAAVEARDARLEAEAIAGRARPMRLAIVGRPNAGKSTLINALLREDRLLTGPEAGITRDAIEVPWMHGGRELRLIDTAGLRKRAKVQDSLERQSTQDTIRALKFADVVALVMDVNEAFERQDLQIGDLALREGRGLLYVLTKLDTVPDPGLVLRTMRERADAALSQARGAPILGLSAQTGRYLDRLLPSAFKLYDDWNAKIKTNDLNRWLRHAVEKLPPPSTEGRRPKLRYIAQLKARPPTFVIMCTRGEDITDTYKRYLANGVRENFDMNGVPLRFVFRSSRNPYARKG